MPILAARAKLLDIRLAKIHLEPRCLNHAVRANEARVIVLRKRLVCKKRQRVGGRSPFDAGLLVEQPRNGAGRPIEGQREVRSLNFLCRVVRSAAGELGCGGLHDCRCGAIQLSAGYRKIADGVVRLHMQSLGQRGQPIRKVLPLLLPTELGHRIVAAVDRKGKIFRRQVIEVEPGLGVGAPRMLRLHQHAAQHGHIGRIARLDLSVRNPFQRSRATSRYRATFSGSLATP